LTFDSGAFASLTYNGYGYFDGDEFCDWVSELGRPKSAGNHGLARRALRAAGDPLAEVALKQARNYGGAAYRPAESDARAHEHFGTCIVSCERADLRPLPRGVMIYDGEGARLEPVAPPAVPRVEVIDELEHAIATGVPALHDGHWARATLEVCQALLESSRTGGDVGLEHQVGAAGASR
jgi:phthalate 4,5-cis-dihydrodiol dehydrogenase